MPDDHTPTMRCRLITRDISQFPMRDLEKVAFSPTDLQVYWGDRKLPNGTICILDLGIQVITGPMLPLERPGGLWKPEDAPDTSATPAQKKTGRRRAGSAPAPA